MREDKGALLITSTPLPVSEAEGKTTRYALVTLGAALFFLPPNTPLTPSRTVIAKPAMRKATWNRYCMMGERREGVAGKDFGMWQGGAVICLELGAGCPSFTHHQQGGPHCTKGSHAGLLWGCMEAEARKGGTFSPGQVDLATFCACLTKLKQAPWPSQSGSLGSMQYFQSALGSNGPYLHSHTSFLRGAKGCS